MENSPTRLYVEAVVLSRFIQLLLENFSGFRSASLEHNASSAERVLPAPSAKLRNISETNKNLAGNFRMSEIFCTFVPPNATGRAMVCCSLLRDVN